MKTLKYIFSSSLVLIWASINVWAQEIKIEKINIINDQIAINYEIDDSNPNNEYWVKVYSSKDNFSTPLTRLSGDVGQEVKPGKKIAKWSINEEYADYSGPLQFEIRASVYIPFVRLRDNTIKESYKKGKQFELTWRPGNTNPVHIELFKDNKRLQGELNHPNDGKYSTVFSKDLNPGKGYKIKITDSKQPDQFIFTESFSIKRKIPLLLQVIPAVVIVGVVTQLGINYAGGEGAGGGGSLPDAPTAPEN